ncbi:MAG: hypothetical protein WC848_01230 [Parcubacteria group bacterium]
MNLEGKVYGYEKKVLAVIVLVVFVAGAMFYAGAKYEKRKLDKLGLLRNAPAKTAKKKEAPKNPPAENATPEDNSTTPNKQDNTAPAAPEANPGAPKAPTATTPATMPVQN